MSKDITEKWQLRILNSFECTGSNSVLNLPLWQQKQQGRNCVYTHHPKCSQASLIWNTSNPDFAGRYKFTGIIQKCYCLQKVDSARSLQPSKTGAGFWAQLSLISAAADAWHRKALGWEELNCLPQPMSSLTCHAPLCSGSWGEAIEAAGVTRPSAASDGPGRPWPLSRAGLTTLHRLWDSQVTNASASEVAC